jgi:ribonuclease D
LARFYAVLAQTFFSPAGFVLYCTVIDTDEKVAGFLPKLREAKWVALDTEADSLHAYPEKLCLIQLSIEGHDELIDPLAGTNLEPVLDTLKGQELIMHGADYDLRLLRKSLNFVPKEMFDTMLAARLLGIREFGLNNLVGRFLDVKLEKGPQKANWARRPLTERMADYARNDARYLKPLSDILRDQLMQKARLDWHRQMCQRLIQDCAQMRPADPDVVWRVKGSHHLQPAALGVLRELWQWREQEAVRANRPPFFILPPDTMVQLANAAAHTGEVQDVLPAHLTPRRREGIIKAVAKGMAVKKPPGVIRAAPYRQNETEKRRMHDLERRRDRAATDLGVDPTLIASRAVLVLLAKDWQAHQGELLDWQRQLLEAPEAKRESVRSH